jgi:hypothetical protein
VALGLEDLVAADAPELADRAVHRAYQIGLGQRPRSGLERAREELVEAAVGGDVAVGRLGHVDAVAADEPADQPRGGCAALRPGHPAGQARDRALGQQVLGPYGQAVIGHGQGVGERARDCIDRVFALALASTPQPETEFP